jgi:hypothetical protein
MADDTERLREEWKQRQGSHTRKWRDMTGDKPAVDEVDPEAEEVAEEVRARRVRTSWSELGER